MTNLKNDSEKIYNVSILKDFDFSTRPATWFFVVRNGYEIKDNLKSHGYKFDNMDKCWKKEFSINIEKSAEFISECEFLKSLNCNILNRYEKPIENDRKFFPLFNPQKHIEIINKIREDFKNYTGELDFFDFFDQHELIELDEKINRENKINTDFLYSSLEKEFE
jgi:hypothetical protein